MKQYEFTDITTVKIDFASLEEYRDSSKDDLPVYSMISFYKAIGLTPYLEEYKEKTGEQIIPFDNIMCNFDTLNRIKLFIKNQWQTYSLDVDSDNHVFWKGDQYGHTRHYAKNLSKSVEASIITDFMNYCPGTDEELEDDEIVFRTYKTVEVPDEEGGETIEGDKEAKIS